MPLIGPHSWKQLDCLRSPQQHPGAVVYQIKTHSALHAAVQMNPTDDQQGADDGGKLVVVLVQSLKENLRCCGGHNKSNKQTNVLKKLIHKSTEIFNKLYSL